MKSLRDSLKLGKPEGSISGMPKSGLPIIDHKDERDFNVLWIEIMK